jgi:endonuclease/exonuclease/phosphatase family metal-dependent hydrolase
VLETLETVREKHGTEIPVIFMGDLNCNVDSEALRMVDTELDNAISCATVSKSMGTASSHAIGKAPSTTSLPIDHIYVTSEYIDVYTHLILTGGENVLKSSDHCPVICEITLK